jgi:hypothetical protein
VCASSRRRLGRRHVGSETRPAGPLPLPLRNRLAELILDAFEPGEARATVLALALACDAAGCAVDAADADRLLALGWFERASPGRVRLLSAHRAHARALADRAERAASLVRDWRSRGADGLTPLLERAAGLANHGLFFELHELLEPAWFRAAGPLRTALQGLIQVAVGFHHLENGNQEGARSLLVEGVAKVAGAGAALPLETTGWLGELQVMLATLAGGGRLAVMPRWPRPESLVPQRLP